MNDLTVLDDARTAVQPPLLERRRMPRRPPTHVRVWVAGSATIGLAVTLLLSATSLVAFAYRSVPLHVAVETTAALASIVAAELLHGRFRRTLQLRDLILFAGLASFAVTNGVFSAIPSLLSAGPGAFRTWAPVGGSLLSTVLLLAAAFVPDRRIHRPRIAVRRTLLAGSIALALIAAGVLLAAQALPLGFATIAADRPRAAGTPVVVAVQVISGLLFGAAAGGFAARAERDRDVLARWLAVAATLGAFARLNYAIFPSLYTEWFYAGDVLRLGCFLAVFAGAVHETRRLQAQLAQAAVVDERHRIARNIHDGVAQDLAFLVQQLRSSADEPVPPRRIERLVDAAERALDESRHAIASLARATDSALADALATTAREAGEREGSIVETDLAGDVAVPADVQEELLRVVREAVINAARHGRAARIHVSLRQRPALTVTVEDDGSGFDPGASPPGRLGLAGMAARVERLGGRLDIESSPGHGTRVRITLP